jgi:lipoyl(octanoyl) transferase
MHGFPTTMQLLNLPSTPFQEAWDIQRSIFDGVVTSRTDDTLILLEHPHVYTLGRVTDNANVLLSDAKLSEIGAEKLEIDRGGDVTYHGPGQLVGYPILNLAHFKEDLGWYLRTLEESVIHLLAQYGIEAFREGRTGVWVNTSGRDEKICAIGIRCSRWCTMHGFALNANTDLRYFEHIVPCGIRDKGVTSMQKILGRPVEMSEIRERYAESFAEIFGVTFQSVQADAAAIQ